MRNFMALAGLTALGACANVDMPALEAQLNTDLFVAANREVDVNYRDLPFDTGTIYVIANEHGDMHTYTLTPCRDGTRICGGSGSVGQVARTPDFYVVTGAYPGRTFHLSPGGDGYLTWRGEDRDLAWN